MAKWTLNASYGLVFIALAGCDRTEPVGPDVSGSFDLAVARGEIAFLGECAQCHAARDGFDLAFFQFTDTTIVRRAVAHVTDPTAQDIVAYISSLDTYASSRHARPFHPGEALLSSDRSFAIRLFGMEGIPPDLDTEALRGIDPLEVAVAVPLPQWSIEENNLDWMRDGELPDRILDDRASLARERLAQYYSNPTTENLGSTVAALRGADGDWTVLPPPASFMSRSEWIIGLASTCVGGLPRSSPSTCYVTA